MSEDEMVIPKQALIIAAAVIALVIGAAVLMKGEKPAPNNFSFTYTTTKDGKFSSAARTGSNGKVLIFGRPTCGFTQKTVKSAAESSRIGTSDIDFAFIDIDNSPKSKIEAYERQVKCKYITFCYGEAPRNEYIELLPESEISGNMYQLPLVVYIDGNNSIIAVSSGPKTADEIFAVMDSPKSKKRK